jgi:hypothetical protein
LHFQAVRFPASVDEAVAARGDIDLTRFAVIIQRSSAWRTRSMALASVEALAPYPVTFVPKPRIATWPDPRVARTAWQRCERSRRGIVELASAFVENKRQAS